MQLAIFTQALQCDDGNTDGQKESEQGISPKLSDGRHNPFYSSGSSQL